MHRLSTVWMWTDWIAVYEKRLHRGNYVWAVLFRCA